LVSVRLQDFPESPTKQQKKKFLFLASRATERHSTPTAVAIHQLGVPSPTDVPAVYVTHTCWFTRGSCTIEERTGKRLWQREACPQLCRTPSTIVEWKRAPLRYCLFIDYLMSFFYCPTNQKKCLLRFRLRFATMCCV
jgi:hypothetical protein